MSPNYPLFAHHQNTTQKVTCSDCQATFNLTIVESYISENFSLHIHDGNTCRYNFTNGSVSNFTTISFNSSQLIIEYQQLVEGLQRSTGFILHYEAISLGPPSEEPKETKSHMWIVVLCVIIGVFMLTGVGTFVWVKFGPKKDIILAERVAPEQNSCALKLNTMEIEELESEDTPEMQEALLAQLEKIDKKLKFPHDSEEYVFNQEELNFIEPLASTTRNIVKKCIHIPTGTKMAVKIMRIPKDRVDNSKVNNKLRRMLREIENFKTLSSNRKNQNIVDFYGFCQVEGEAWIFMELMDLSLSDLYEKVNRAKMRFPENLLGYITVKLIDGLMFCKSKKIVHRDIKPSNILMNYE